MQRKNELFESIILDYNKNLSVIPPICYPQERDWTCAFACIRSLLSAIDEDVISEDELVEKYQLTPEPYYSADIKKMGLLDEYDAVYGCDMKKITFLDILELCDKGYYIMLESMVNYSHWMVFMGYLRISNKNNLEQNQFLFFEPYYNQMRLMIAEEFLGMWIDGDYMNSKVKKDFIAIKAK